ncbi:MAG TPA: PASTA domain-containing protein, partial [Phytomonospora sp.]
AVGDRAVREYHVPPLSSLTPGADGEESTGPGVGASSGPTTSPEDGDETGDDRPGTPGTDEPEPDPGDGDPGGDDEDPGTAKVPDLTGVPVASAADRLRSYGFDNSKGEAEMDWQGETCVVTGQSPKAGSVVDVGTLITFHYIETYPQCLSQSLNIAAVPAPVLPPPGASAVVSRDRAAVARRARGGRGRR